MSDITYVTKEGLERLLVELHDLTKVQRPAISAQIGEARDKGDLSENAEYDAAKEAQGLLEMKISKLKTTIANCRILDESKLDITKVTIFSKVKVRNLKMNNEMEYTLVSEKEQNFKEFKISVKSAIGGGLLGKRIGDIVKIQVPAGLIELEIIDLGR
jgi:transcription elongation factor GreA